MPPSSSSPRRTACAHFGGSLARAYLRHYPDESQYALTASELRAACRLIRAL